MITFCDKEGKLGELETVLQSMKKNSKAIAKEGTLKQMKDHRSYALN